jgi:iron complex transport system substrate-binding protein
MKAQIAEVAQKVRDQPVVKVIAYGGGQGPLNLDGGQATLTTQIIEAAGGENVFADQKRFFTASLEAVAAKQADVFVIYAYSKDATDTLDGTKEAQFLFTTFPNMQTSKDRRVIVSDYMFTSSGWRNARTVEDFARQLHPDVFK